LTSLKSTQRWLILPPTLLGVAILYFASMHGPRLESTQREEVTRTMRVIEVPVTRFVPRVLGYGEARAAQVWNAVAEVQGKVKHVHADLNAGVIIRAGTLLVTIDRSEYGLALAKRMADLRRAENELAELDLRKANLTAMLTIEESSLELADKKVKRQQDLASKNAGSKEQLDLAKRDWLQQRQRVQAQKHLLELIPSQRRTLQATIESHTAGVKDAELDLAKTEIRAPFDCRLRDVETEVGQFVSAGQELFIADGTAATEVVAQVAIEKAATLVDHDRTDFGQVLALLASRETTSIPELFSLEATVRVNVGDFESSWDARFDSVTSNIDPKSRTIGLVTTVDRPYEKVIPGERPPLVRGLFCEVEFRGPARNQEVVIPRTAIDSGQVYVVSSQNRLERRQIEIKLVQGSLAVIGSGLEAGERLVVSDPTPAIDGQLIEAIADKSLLEELLLQAAGEDRLR
jgi:multidrug efflux system membrane fusion protein